MILISCQNDRNLDGNYSVCFNGEYSEVYFKKDSMRMASESEWVSLSEWRKIEVKNDTLYFETFGEWRDSATAEIKYIGLNKIELKLLEANRSINLEPINKSLNFEKPKELWNGFIKRLNSSNCEKKTVGNKELS